MSEREKPKSGTAAADTTYFVVVGGLLILIIAVLAFLWQAERRRRVGAESELANLRNQMGMRAALSQLLGRPQAGPEPIEREDLDSEQVEFGGKVRTALRISASTGERFGFLPGDLIDVAE
ncbi:MAG: hypothetical protein KAU28_01000, partial [Phycisphaerae bacterium]|nr:hypothetical protein [Phycisphaerae bacterium]